MPQKSTWEESFDAHAPLYDENEFTENTVRERAFVPTKLSLLCRLAGMSVLNVWGGTGGNWGRRTIDLDEIEIMIVARKTAEPCAAADADRALG